MHASRVTINVHDDPEDRTPVIIQDGTAPGLPPYWLIRFNRDDVTIFTDAARLLEIRDAIDKALEEHASSVYALEAQATLERELAEQRAEDLIEERDALETGADRCPPRE